MLDDDDRGYSQDLGGDIRCGELRQPKHAGHMRLDIILPERGIVGFARGSMYERWCWYWMDRLHASHDISYARAMQMTQESIIGSRERKGDNAAEKASDHDH